MNDRSGYLLVLLLCSCALWAQEKPRGHLHGLIVADYFYKAGGDQLAYGDVNTQYSSNIPHDFQAFELRRLHFFYDHTISETFFTRFQLEGNNKTLEPGGRFSLYVKTAYAEWRNIFKGSQLLAGLVPTPTWSSVEGIWGYRSIEKSIADARNLGSGSDLGVLLRGTLPSATPIGYAVMIGNGNAQRPENDRYKKFYTMINIKPADHFHLEATADYKPAANDLDAVTIKTMAAYMTSVTTAGFEVVQQRIKSGGSGTAAFGTSFFIWHQLTDKHKIFGRLDYYDPNRYAANQGFYELFISIGLDYAPVKEIHVQPNLWVMYFRDKSSLNIHKAADVFPRITFNYLFN